MSSKITQSVLEFHKKHKEASKHFDHIASNIDGKWEYFSTVCKEAAQNCKTYFKSDNENSERNLEFEYNTTPNNERGSFKYSCNITELPDLCKATAALLDHFADEFQDQANNQNDAMKVNLCHIADSLNDLSVEIHALLT